MSFNDFVSVRLGSSDFTPFHVKKNQILIPSNHKHIDFWYDYGLYFSNLSEFSPSPTSGHPNEICDLTQNLFAKKEGFEEMIRMDDIVPLENKVIGCLLLGGIADAMGTSIEGWSRKRIQMKYKLLDNFVEGTHMGLRHLGNRFGMYSDDTNSVLALSSSIVECNGFDPKHIAHQYSKFFHSGIQRGYPNSAMEVLKAIKEGMNYTVTGRLVFSDGSFANGGAMRIAPIGILWRDCLNRGAFREYVRLAIISSHVHPQAIDGAYCIAKFVQHSMNCQKPSEFNFENILDELTREVITSEMKRYLLELQKYLFSPEKSDDDEEESEGEVTDKKPVTEEVDDDKDNRFLIKLLVTPGFQIRATDAIAVVLLGIYRYYKNPALCISKIFSYGGDTDTTGAMAGNILGALYGDTVIPKKWFDEFENNERGRDYIIDLAKKLAKVNIDVSKKPTIKEILYIDVNRLERWSKTFGLLKTLQRIPILAKSRQRISNLSEETKQDLEKLKSIDDLEEKGSIERQDLSLTDDAKNGIFAEKVILHYGKIENLTTNVLVFECNKSLIVCNTENQNLFHLVGGETFFESHMEKVRKKYSSSNEEPEEEERKKEEKEEKDLEDGKTRLDEGSLIKFFESQGKGILFAVSPTGMYTQPPDYKIKKFERRFSEEKRRILERLYWDILLWGKRKMMRVIAFPALSTDIMFGFDFNRIEMAKIALRTVRKFLAQYGNYNTVVFVVQSVENHEIYEKLMQFYFPV